MHDLLTESGSGTRGKCLMVTKSVVERELLVACESCNCVTISEKTQLFTVFFSTQEFKWILYRLTIKTNIYSTKYYLIKLRR